MAEAAETPCQPSCNEAVDVSFYSQPVGLLQLTPSQTAMVDHSPTAVCSKRRCSDRFGAFFTGSRQAGIKRVALAARHAPHHIQDIPPHVPCSYPLLSILCQSYLIIHQQQSILSMAALTRWH